jgi:hypothetical protein
MYKRFEPSKMVGNQPGALSRKDAAIYIGVSTRQLDKLAAARLIRRAKIGAKTVYRVIDLDVFLESRLQPAESV